MKWIKCLLLTLVAHVSLNALANYADVYPPIQQNLTGSSTFTGNRHGKYKGDIVAVLSDGSAWKIYKRSEKIYVDWKEGDVVHISARKSPHVLKRKHKFYLHNDSRSEKVKVMLIQYPTVPLQIVSEKIYAKRTNRVCPDKLRKSFVLSDGSSWVIKKGLKHFYPGMTVYVGAQGKADKYYDFPIISGDEDKAFYVIARPEKK